MGFAFNPFTGNFDVKGAGGGGASYIDGEVQNFSALPETIGSPAVDSAYLVREAEGAWLLNRKPAGIYIRTANTGTRASDWTYAGEFPDVFSDDKFVLYDETDSSKNLVFQLSGITTGATRTLTVPNASGRIQVEGQPIGNTTPAAGTFTTLAANNGTLTASAPVLDLSQTWNASGVTFTGLRFNVTNTASAAASLLADFQVGGTTQFAIRRNGNLNFPSQTNFFFSGNATPVLFDGTGTPSPSIVVPALGADGNLTLFTGRTGSGDMILRVVGGSLEQRNGTNPQTFRLYNTFTDASNHERLSLRWASNVAIIGTEKAGTGSARALEFQTDGTTRLTIATTGESTFASGGAVVISNNTASSSATTGALRVTGGIGTSGAVQAGGVFRGYDLLLWNSASRIVWEGRAITLSSPANGVIEQASTTTAQAYRLFNNVSGANFERANFRWASNEFIIDAEAGGTGTLRGIKIGSATTSLLGFYGVTPVDQPATVADPAGGGTVDTEARTAINAVIDRLQELGLIA